MVSETRATAILIPDNFVHPLQTLALHRLEQKKNRAERLILRGRANAPDGQAGHIRCHLALAELAGMALAVKDDESPVQFAMAQKCMENFKKMRG